MFQETSLLKFHKQMNSREVSKYDRPLWVSMSYRKGGHMTQKRSVVPDNEPRSYRKGNSHRNDWRENYMTIEMKMDQRYEQGKNEGIQLGRSEGEISKERELITKWLQKGKTITEIAEDLDQSEEYVKSLICSQE